MVGSWAYDLMYRTWAPWDSVGVRSDLEVLLARPDVTPQRFPKWIDLGCGTGANVVHLARHGFEAWGVDFSEVAVRKARRRAEEAGVSARFVVGDLTAPEIDGAVPPFDGILDFGTLDDLAGEDRVRMAATITRLARPGSLFLEYCFFGEREALPWMSRNASKFSHVAPGELEDLLSASWRIEPFAEYPKWRTRVFLLTRR